MAGWPATAPGQGKAEQASLLKRILFLLNAVCAVRLLLTVSSCLPFHHTLSLSLMLSYFYQQLRIRSLCEDMFCAVGGGT